MKKFLLLLTLSIVFITCSETDSLTIDESNPFVFKDIFVLQMRTFANIETTSSKVYDSDNNLIGFQNDWDTDFVQEFEFGGYYSNGEPYVDEILIRVFEVQVTKDIQDFIYLKINDTELDKDDISNLLQTKCNIRVKSVYGNTDNVVQLKKELESIYCKEKRDG